MFSKTTDPIAQEILDEIKTLSTKVAQLEGKRDAAREELNLADDIVRLKRELVNLEIEKDRVEETHAREKREVEHMVGLERKRGDFEKDAAKRDVTLTVREENLKAQIGRFEEQMTFRTERFDAEVSYLKELMGQILERLPHVEVDKVIEMGTGGRSRSKAS